MMSVNKAIDGKFRKARIWSNQELKLLSSLFTGDIANISAGDDIDKEGSTYREYFFNAKSYTITNFSGAEYRGFKNRPNEIELDLTGNIPKKLQGKFDAVFNHTTLEHIFDVNKAFYNLCELTSDIVILVVPFCQVQHENDGYFDYWRFTPTALRKMFYDQGLSVIYESANNEFNTSVYLFFIASKHPKNWRNKMPAYKPLEKVGDWVGSEVALKKIYQIIKIKIIAKLSRNSTKK